MKECKSVESQRQELEKKAKGKTVLVVLDDLWDRGTISLCLPFSLA